MLTRQQLLDDPEGLDQLIRQHRMFREAIEHSPMLFCVYDAQGRLVAWNPAYEANHPEAFAARGEDARAGRLTYAELVRYHLALSHSGPELDRAVAERVAMQRDASGEPVERYYANLGHVRVMKYRLPSGASAGFAVNIDDLVRAEQALAAKATELERAYAVMREQALHDALTGLPNRRYMDDFLSSVTAGAGDGVARVAMLHLDLDRFKSINDTLGHAAGDQVLCHVAGVLRRLCGPDDFAARVGGDEFTVICTNAPPVAALTDLANRMIEEISKPQVLDGQRYRIGVSIGIASLGSAGDTAADLMRQADLALYHAKESGRCRVSIFDPQQRVGLQAVGATGAVQRL